jgi:GT2 family glycosyltransferase
MLDCSASVVIYNNPLHMLSACVESFLDTPLQVHLTIMDNSPKPHTLEYPKTTYRFTGANLGYGKAHNLAIFDSEPSRYHLILNPDIQIGPGTLSGLFSYMEQNPDVGIVCPRVLGSDGTVQHLNRRQPNVLDLYLRRFAPEVLKRVFRKRLDHYAMCDTGYDDICDVESLSGCFMFCRTAVLRDVGGMSPQYFMYFEDYDLSRKVQQQGFRTVYNPAVSVIHHWGQASYSSAKMTLIHLASAWNYFNTWGWKWR